MVSLKLSEVVIFCLVEIIECPPDTWILSRKGKSMLGETCCFQLF